MSRLDFTLRELNPEDSETYAQLVDSSPDTGLITTFPHFEVDAYQALLAIHKETVGIVAETPGYPGFIGSGLIRSGQCQWDGGNHPYALLNTLVVHPNFRRMGVATQLAKWREEYARQRFGEDAVTFAIIQINNTGSELTAKKWYKQFISDKLVIIPINMRSKPPENTTSFHVRPIKHSELEQVASELNAYYKDYALYTLETDDSLGNWLKESPFDTPLHHYLVVTDNSNNILAGIGLAEFGRLRSIHITKVPTVMQWMNKILKVIPENGVIKELGTSRAWHAPGHIKAARYLFETIRWEWRGRGTSLMTFTDVRNPILDVYNIRPWTIKSSGGIALRGPTIIPDDTLIYYA